MARSRKLPRGVTERRRAERRRLRFRVRLEPTTLHAITHDLSRTGVFVRSARVLKPGSRVDLTVSLPSGPARVRGVVRWARRVPVQLMQDVRGGMGIEFEGASAALDPYLYEG